MMIYGIDVTFTCCKCKKAVEVDDPYETVGGGVSSVGNRLLESIRAAAVRHIPCDECVGEETAA